MTLAILNTNDTMTSLELIEVVNQARAMHGEPEIRRNDFAARCVNELDGEYYETFVVENHNGTSSVGIRMTRDQCMYVLMRESKSVRRTATQQLNKPQSAELSRLDILTLAMESERGRLEAIEQRDYAIATKAQIGSKREATAMATASAAKKESAKLKALMGEATENASIIAVQNKTGVKTYKWRDLKNYCEAAGLGMGKSFNPGLQLNVNTYPAGAWFEVYGVDLVDLFGEVTA